MLPNRSKAVFFGSLLCLCTARADAATALWVQAVQVDLKTEAQMSAAPVLHLKRGDQVALLTTQGLWLQVTVHGKTGWLSKIFLSDHPPIGNAELSKEVNVSMEKTTRRRSSSYAVSASTRGLQADKSISRRGEDTQRPDYRSLEKMEHFQLDSRLISRFAAEAREGAL